MLILPTVITHVEHDKAEPSEKPAVDHKHQSESHEYCANNKMSSKFFRYIIKANGQTIQQIKRVQNYCRKDYIGLNCQTRQCR